MLREFLTYNLEVLVASLALLVSILSVAITLYWNRRTFKHQVKHDQLSVKPLTHVFYDYSGNILRICLKNTGFGPLIIRSFAYLINDKLYTSLDFMAIDEKIIRNIE